MEENWPETMLKVVEVEVGEIVVVVVLESGRSIETAAELLGLTDVDRDCCCPEACHEASNAQT